MGTDGVAVALRDSVRNCKSSGASLRIVVASTFWMFWAHGPRQTFAMWPGLPQLKQRPWQGSLFTGWVRSRSMGWGTEDAVGAEGQEEEDADEVATAETMAGGGTG